MGRSCISMPDIETTQAVLFSLFFGIGLPSFDVSSDVRLAIRLYINGHPRWALSVMTPIIFNTFFTTIACRAVEKNKSGCRWLMYLPLVLLQIYPQFCIVRLLLKLFRGKMNLKAFISSRDGMEGGIGCLEPYCESVLQVFVQTALFAYVHNINPLLRNLCFNERRRSCAEYDVCDNLYHCDMDPFVSGYERYEKITNSTQLERDCRSKFDECIGNFTLCINECKANMTEYIYGIQDDTLLEYLNTPAMFLNSTLAIDNDATLDDLKVIQMHRLVIGNYSLFISTYGISIAAACFGMTKFFRLSHARMTKKIFTKKFLYVSVVSAIFFGIKGIVLAGVVMGNEASLAQSVGIWILFTMLPTAVMVMIFTVMIPYVKLYKKYRVFNIGAVAQMIVKQPCLLLAPHITPFFFTLDMDKETMIDNIPTTMINDKEVKMVSIGASYAVSSKLTIINSLLSMIFAIALLAWKSQWVSDFWHIFFVTIVALVIFFFVGFLGYVEVDGLYKGDLPCVEHDQKDCLDCIRVYSFFGEAIKLIKACDDHEQAPYQYKT